jgi:ParB family transcriptional regulator, chromosome partitioning protein
MDTIKPRLGRGLDALLGTMGNDGTATITATATVSLDRIQNNPFQPRKRFDDDELNQLASSIKEHGILQPVVVRSQGDGHYQLIAGERRVRAAQVAGLTAVPVHVVDFNDQQIHEAALVENIQRSDLNAIEKAQGFRDYLSRFTINTEQLATKLGMDRTTISNLLGLLNMAPEVQDAVRLGQVSLGHAKVLKGITDHTRQIALCKETILKNLSVHALDMIVKTVKQNVPGAKPAKVPAEKTPHVQSVENELRQRLSVRVDIQVKAKEKGQIVIGFETNDDFERILEALRK